jgi:hypothetical protein
MPSNSAGTTSGTGSAQIDPYVIVGPTFQTANFGWGTSYWGDSTWGTERTTTSVVLRSRIMVIWITSVKYLLQLF